MEGEGGAKAPATATATATTTATGVTYTAKAMTPSEAWRRMWTKADKYHTHGISGGVFTLLGAGVLAA